MDDIIQVMDKSPVPSLLPILRSHQQGELLFYVLGNPEKELSLTGLSEQLAFPYASVHREVERALAAGLVASRSVGRTRLIQANTESPYFESLADLLLKAFGPPVVLGQLLGSVDGVAEAFVIGSWASAYQGVKPERPIGDIDVLVLGDPDRDALYAVATEAERRLGRAVQVVIREQGWLENGSGAFHANVQSGHRVAIEFMTAQSE